MEGRRWETDQKGDGRKKGTCNEHWVFSISDELLNSALESNITVYVNFKLKKEKSL